MAARQREQAVTTYYEALDVDPTADRAAIKKAFVARALEYHPDKQPGGIATQVVTCGCCVARSPCNSSLLLACRKVQHGCKRHRPHGKYFKTLNPAVSTTGAWPKVCAYNATRVPFGAGPLTRLLVGCTQRRKRRVVLWWLASK